MKTNTKSLLALTGAGTLALTAASQAAVIAINDTNFARFGGGAVSNTYTDANHVRFRYIGTTDYLATSQTFSVDFTFNGGDSSGGAGFWFGPQAATSVNWIFASHGSGTSEFRRFAGRNVTTNAGGTPTSIDTVSPSLTTVTLYTIVVDRQISGTTVNLDLKLFQGATELAGGTHSYTGALTDVSWGITSWTSAFPLNGDVITLSNLTVVPEPSTALLGAIGTLALLRRRR